MAGFQYLVLASAVSGREAELEAWYRDRHLPDVARVAGVTSARCFRIDKVMSGPSDADWVVLAVYEIEADDPNLVLDEIKRRAGTDQMPMSKDFVFQGSLQILAS